MVKLHLRFDEGRAGRTIVSLSLLVPHRGRRTDRRLPHFGAPISRANTHRQIDQKGYPTAGSLRPLLQAHSSVRESKGELHAPKKLFT